MQKYKEELGNSHVDTLHREPYNKKTNTEKDNSEINLRNQQRIPFLHIACQTGNLEIVKFLLEQGANVNNNSLYGNPLHLLCQNKVDVETAKKITDLLDKKDTKNEIFTTKDSDGRIPLLLAIKNYPFEYFEFILDKTINALRKANNDNDVDIYGILIDNEGLSSLHYACNNPDVKILTHLCQNRREKISNEKTKQLLQYAAYLKQVDHIEIIKKILNTEFLKSFDFLKIVLGVSDDFLEGASTPDLDFIEKLNKQKLLDPNAKNEFGENLLDLLLYFNFKERDQIKKLAIFFIKTLQLNPDQQDDQTGKTTFHRFFDKINKCDKEYFNTANFHFMFMDTIEMLIKISKRMDIQDNNGNSYLHCLVSLYNKTSNSQYNYLSGPAEKILNKNLKNKQRLLTIKNNRGECPFETLLAISEKTQSSFEDQNTLKRFYQKKNQKKIRYS